MRYAMICARRFLPPFTLYLIIVLLLGVVLISFIYLYSNLFPKNDFAEFYQKSILFLLQGQNPYINSGLYNPPWIYLLLSPLILVPTPAGAAVLTLLNLLALAWLLYRSHVTLPVFLFALFSPVTLCIVMTSNIDGLLLLGVLLPPQWGLFLVLAKPQLGLGIAIFWAWEAFHEEVA